MMDSVGKSTLMRYFSSTILIKRIPPCFCRIEDWCMLVNLFKWIFVICWICFVYRKCIGNWFRTQTTFGVQYTSSWKPKCSFTTMYHFLAIQTLGWKPYLPEFYPVIRHFTSPYRRHLQTRETWYIPLGTIFLFPL